MRYLAVLLLLFLLGGCQQQEEQPTAQDAAPVAQATSSGSVAQPAPGGSSYSFTLPGESSPTEVVLTDDSLKLGSDWEARFDNDEVKVYQDGKIKAIGKFKKDGRAVVSDSAGNRMVKIKIRDDGDFKVVDPQEAMICKLKFKDDGFKVVGPDEETVLVKVKASDGKTKIKDGSEKEIAKFKGSSDPTVVTWLAIPNLPKEVRMACALMFRGTR